MAKETKRTRTVWKKLKWTLIAILLALACAAIWYAYSIYQFAGNIQSAPDDSRFQKFSQKDQNTLTPPEWTGKERVNILLLGGDSRGLKKNEIPRSDSMLVVSLDPVTKQASLFSVLRDTYVAIPGHGHGRINTAITLGGPDLAMQTVGELLGLSVQYYVYTDFKGFIQLIDAMGGIDFFVEKDMKYSDSEDDHLYDINLKKGMQHLNGTTALQYVRFRHDAMSDYSRTERQRNFLEAVVKKLKSTYSLIRLPKILNSIEPSIETNLSVDNMWKLASLGFKIDTTALVSQQVPPTELLSETTIGGASVIEVNSGKLQQFVDDLFNRQKEGLLSGGDEADTQENGDGRKP